MPYQVLARHYLPGPSEAPGDSLLEVLERRRTGREFGDVPLSLLSALLWYVARTKASHTLPSGAQWQHRPVPSAGGRHPIDLLIVRPVRAAWQVAVYDEQAHALCELKVERTALHRLLKQVRSLLPLEHGSLIWHVAHPHRTLSKYQQGSSLIWRDSGVLTGYLTLMAEALHLNCCLLGITGEPSVSAMLGMPGVVGVGGCVIGLAENSQAG